MKFFAAYLRWLNLPGALLLALLQRTPVVRIAAIAEECVLASPAGAVLRAAVAAVASLGALHSLAGATQVVPSTSAVNTAVGTPITPVVFVTNGAPTPALSYIVTGVPPGLTVPGLNPATNILNVNNAQGSGSITGTPTIAGSYPVTIQAWEFGDAKGNFSPTITVLFTITGAGATGQPNITAQPVSQTTVLGQSVTFSVGVTANPAATYQWFKEGVLIVNATSSSYSVASAKTTDAGNYFVIVTNSFGSVQSSAAVLQVSASPPNAPVFTLQPQSQNVATGSTVVFGGAAGSVPAPTYQWWRGPTPVAGATSPTLVLTGANVVGGSYTLVASNVVGTTTSNPAILTVAPTTNPGRLINLSILTSLTTGEVMTMGTVLGGVGTNGSKALLARAAGPSLTQFGLNGVLPDPKMAVIAKGTGLTLDTNNDWGGTPTLLNAFNQVGAFAYSSSSSKDAAILLQTLAPGDYTVQVSDFASGSGTVIAELYDSTPTSAFTLATPRLVNVSVLKQIASGATLTVGFVVGGTTAKTVLVRAIGPGLAQFGVTGTMADPQLALFNTKTNTKIAENDNWGGDSQVTTVVTAVGAFKIDNAASKDAILLVTLAPGNYAAQVSGVGGTGGTAIVEVYEVP